MIRKKYSSFIRIFLIGVSILFACSTAISRNSHDQKIVMDYIPIPFEQLIGMSDLIVLGSVEDIGNSSFKFHVDEFLLGRHASEFINVIKYIPTEIFAPRALPYAKEQRFCLFLSKSSQDSTALPWRILGIAGEGEMLVEGEFIYFAAYDLKGLEYKPREVQGVTRNLQRFNLNDFIDAVKNYQTCFSWKLVEYIKNKKKRTRWVPSTTCSNTLVKNYQDKSWLHEYLVKKTIKRVPVKNNE